jgi:hypothetical protein
MHCVVLDWLLSLYCICEFLIVSGSSEFLFVLGSSNLKRGRMLCISIYVVFSLPSASRCRHVGFSFDSHLTGIMGLCAGDSLSLDWQPSWRADVLMASALDVVNSY